MAQLKPRDVAAVVKAIEARGAGEAASRALQRIRAVFRYAVVHERIDSNPMLDLQPAELLKPRQVKHRAAQVASELGSLGSARSLGPPATDHDEASGLKLGGSNRGERSRSPTFGALLNGCEVGLLCDASSACAFQKLGWLEGLYLSKRSLATFASARAGGRGQSYALRLRPAA